MTELFCKNCGGTLLPMGDDFCRCENCGSTYAQVTAKKQQELLNSFLDKQKQEQLNSLRRHLWQEATAKFIDSDKIVSICLNIKNIYPEDFLANFYEKACNKQGQEAIDFIDSINVKEHYDIIEPIVNFLIKSLKSEYLLCVNNLIERAFKQTDLEKFNKLTTEFAKQAELVEDGVYNLDIKRDVFVAYSSADMQKVQEVVSAIEGEGLTCFVAMRNLQHGAGAVNNYQQALEKAINNCKIFLFISSKNSRNFKCDAIKHELPYLRDSEMEKLSHKFINLAYDQIDYKYKKPRVQLRLDDTKSMADVLVNEVFAGLEYCYDIESVCARISELLFSKNYAVEDSSQNERQIDESLIQKIVEEKSLKLQEELLKKQAEENNLKQKEELLKKQAEENIRQKEQKVLKALKFKANENGYTIIGIDDNYINTKELIIPSNYNDKPITSIGERAFNGCNALKSVKMPNSITSMGDYVFCDCGSLTKVEISDNLTSISEGTFARCDSLAIVEIPNSVTTIGKYAFSGCRLLKSIKIPDGVKTIDYFAFNECAALAYLEMPESLTWIGISAFCKCSSLTSIKIPNSVTHIGKTAFDGCCSLTSVEIGTKITSIGDNAFDYCPIENAIIPAIACAYIKNNKLKSVKITSGNAIANSAFAGCEALNSIEIGASVTSIGDYVFSGCKALENITVAENSFSYSSLNGNLYNKNKSTLIEYAPAKKANSFAVPTGVISIAKQAFYNCKSLTNVVIPNSVTKIGDYAFFGCSLLTEITIGSSVTSIGKYALSGCSSLTSIVIPESVNTIDLRAFAGCLALTIYCKAKKQPQGFDKEWNSSNRPVYWYSEKKPFLGIGKCWHYEVNGKPTKW
ncbi:MAG: leucine-rich repeat protein [Clostridia bacterium]|nr:leucine-rich repeat protein [Clostridia bacterium]